MAAATLGGTLACRTPVAEDVFVVGCDGGAESDPQRDAAIAARGEQIYSIEGSSDAAAVLKTAAVYWLLSLRNRS